MPIKQNLTDFFQVQNLIDHHILFKDGSMGFALDITPRDAAPLSNEQLNQFDTQIKTFISSLPENSSAQIIVENKTAQNESVINNHQEMLTADCVSPLTQEITTDRCRRLKKEDALGMIPRPRVLFVFKHSGQKVKKSLLSFLTGSRKQLAQNFTAQSKEILARNDRRLEEIVSSLESLKIEAKTLSFDEIKHELFFTWNPSLKKSDIPATATDSQSASIYSKKIQLSDVVIENGYFQIGESFNRVLSFANLPEQTFASQGSFFTDLPPNVKFFFSFHVPDQKLENEKLSTQRKITFSMLSGAKGPRDIDSEAKFDDIEEVMQQILRTGEKILYLSQAVLIQEPSKELLDLKTRELTAFVRQNFQIELIRENYMGFEIFSDISFPGCFSGERAIRVLSSSVANLMPFLACWQGHKTPSVILKNAWDNLVSFNPFDSSLTNYNQIISGGSGSGKSYLCNILLLQSLKETPKIFIIDIGGSYRKICDQLGGQYIPIRLDSGVQINPFDLPEGSSAPSTQQVKFLSTLVELMTKEEDKAGLGRLEKAEIESAIIELYKNSSTTSPRLSNLRELLADSDDSIVRRFSKNPWHLVRGE